MSILKLWSCGTTIIENDNKWFSLLLLNRHENLARIIASFVIINLTDEIRYWSVNSNHIHMCNYSDVIMSAMASEITGISIVCSTICSGTDQRKRPFDDVIMHKLIVLTCSHSIGNTASCHLLDNHITVNCYNVYVCELYFITIVYAYMICMCIQAVLPVHISSVIRHHAFC